MPGKKDSKKKRRTRTPLLVRKARQYLGPVSGAVVALALAAAYVSDEQSVWHKMTRLQHESPVTPGMYRKGSDDFYFVAFFAVALVFGRYMLQRMVFFPLAAAAGIKGSLTSNKFAEQGWQVLYYASAWISGLTVMLTTEGWEWWKPEQLWAGYPHRDLPPLTKYYYLLQLAFWISQVLVTVVEEWRADFPIMMTHHFVTIGLIAGSYSINFTRVGTAILVEQDLADIFLPLAKLFRYAKQEAIATVVFATFALTWIPTRHGVFFVIYWSLLTQAPVILEGKYNPELGEYWSLNGVYYPYLAVLGLLQVLLLIWLKDLLVAVYRALTSTGQVDDHRSDNEDEDNDDDEIKDKHE